MIEELVPLFTAFSGVILLVCVGWHLVTQMQFSKQIEENHPSLWKESNLSISTETLGEQLKMSFAKRIREKETEDLLSDDPRALALLKRLVLLARASALSFCATIIGAILMGALK